MGNLFKKKLKENTKDLIPKNLSIYFVVFSFIKLENNYVIVIVNLNIFDIVFCEEGDCVNSHHLNSISNITCFLSCMRGNCAYRIDSVTFGAEVKLYIVVIQSHNLRYGRSTTLRWSSSPGRTGYRRILFRFLVI